MATKRREEAVSRRLALSALDNARQAQGQADRDRPNFCPKCSGKNIFTEDYRDGTDYVCLACGWRRMVNKYSPFWANIRLWDVRRGETEEDHEAEYLAAYDAADEDEDASQPLIFPD